MSSTVLPLSHSLFFVLESEECKQRTFQYRFYLTHFIVSMD